MLPDFVAESAGTSAPRPPNMEQIVELNRGAFVGAQPEPSELPLPVDGAQIVDVRPVVAFASGHHAGAVSVPVSGSSFSTKAAFVLDAGRTIVVVAASESEAAHAMRGLRSVGLFRISGYVLGGGAETLGLVEVDELDSLLAEGAELIDVREKDERDSGYIAGSRNIPYRLLALGAGGPPERPAAGHDLRIRPAGCDRRQHPRSARLRRTCGGRGRRRRLAGGRQADGRVPPLRLLTPKKTRVRP